MLLWGQVYYCVCIITGNHTAASESCKRAIAFAKKLHDKSLCQTIEKKCFFDKRS